MLEGISMKFLYNRIWNYEKSVIQKNKIILYNL